MANDEDMRTSLLPPWEPGNPITAERLNKMSDAINQQSRGIALPRKYRKPGGGGGSRAASTTVAVHAASTAAFTLAQLVGSKVVDGITLTEGMLCLLKNQTATSLMNGVWEVRDTDPWVKIGSPIHVIVVGGTLAADTQFVLNIALNTETSLSYRALGAYFK